MLSVGLGRHMQDCFTSVSNIVLPLNNNYALASCHKYDCRWQMLKRLSHHCINPLGHAIFALALQSEAKPHSETSEVLEIICLLHHSK